MGLRTEDIAEGVNGLLMMSSDSFVVWALRRFEASCSSRRGLGGSGKDAGDEVAFREDWKVSMSD